MSNMNGEGRAKPKPPLPSRRPGQRLGGGDVDDDVPPYSRSQSTPFIDFRGRSSPSGTRKQPSSDNLVSPPLLNSNSPKGRPPPPKPTRGVSRPTSTNRLGSRAAAQEGSNSGASESPPRRTYSPRMVRKGTAAVPVKDKTPTRIPQRRGRAPGPAGGGRQFSTVSTTTARPLPNPGSGISSVRSPNVGRSSEIEGDENGLGKPPPPRPTAGGPKIPKRPTQVKRGVTTPTRLSVNTPVKPPKLPEKPASLQANVPLLDFSSEEIRSIWKAMRRLSGSNQQLNAVARIALTALDDAGKSSKLLDTAAVLKGQLGKAREALEVQNKQFMADVKQNQKNEDQEKLRSILHDATEVAQSTSYLVANARKVTLEIDDETLFQRMLIAFNTATESMNSLVNVLLESHGELDDESLKVKLQEAATSIESNHHQLVASRADTMGHLIGPGRKLEIEAACRAAISACWKLINSFRGPIQQHIVIEAKVSACTISQLSTTLTEVAKNTNLLSHKKIRESIEADALVVKELFQKFMEVTKREVASPIPETPKHLEAAIGPLFQRMKEMIARVSAFSRLDTTATSVPDPNPEDKSRAERICALPESIVPPSPKEEEVSETPIEELEATDSIWDEPEDNEENIVLTDGNQVKAATLNKLIERLTSPVFYDLNYMKTFITTFRSFTSPEVLLMKLIQRFRVPDHISNQDEDQTLPIRLRVCNVLRHWVETQHEDFNPALIKRLQEFVNQISKDKRFEKFAQTITGTLFKKQEEENQAKNEIIKLKIEAKIPLSASNLMFVFDEHELAKQLTVVEFAIYSSIQPVELLNQAWNKAKYKHRSPNVLSLIQRSTRLTMWCASVIMWQPTLKERVRAMTKIINIADHLRKMNNFNSLLALISAVNMASVHRLKFTREALSQQTKETFGALEKLMDCNSAYANYRRQLHTVDPPCVPFLGVYLTDLTFVEDGNQDFLKGLINYKKRQLVYNVIGEIQTYQQIGYGFNLVDHIAHFLTELPIINDEEELYQLSLLREPRGAQLSDIV